MRTLGKGLLNIVIACVVFIGYQACKGVFDTFGDVFSINSWASMSAKDIWIFLGSLFVANLISQFFWD